MTTLLAHITEQTCGEACWHAREEVCRCSCGGKNHGILNTNDGKQPDRTRKVGLYRYTLHSVTEGYSNALNIKRELCSTVTGYDEYAFNPNGQDGDPYAYQKAGKSALKWKELSHLVESNQMAKENYELFEMYHEIYLIWRLENVTR